MEKDFWLKKWKKKELGFHNEEAHQDLVELFPKEDLRGKKVFVPLCGKSKDLIWFKEQGMTVVGSELSEQGVLDFFKENNLLFSVQELDNGINLFESFGIQIYQGDFFALQDVGPVDYVYDRASMVALPEGMREAYAKKLKELFPKGFHLFLITLEYDQAQKQGPPFSVPEEEVKKRYEGFNAQTLRRLDDIKGFFSSAPDLSVSHVVYMLSPAFDSQR